MTGKIEGIRLPSLPAHPRIQRKKPAPFARPSVSISSEVTVPVKREWRTVAARELAVGDTVPGIGVLYLAVAVGGSIPTVHLAGGDDNWRTYLPDQPVLAFTRTGRVSGQE